ncbi:MAG: hypothetical protein IKZ56_13245 [Bacteroidales bacterium]|nr:hypothetical protein [Bacteroidales bacterium]MBR5922117.1 hypothetical protein [Bacteroidales bacterium]
MAENKKSAELIKDSEKALKLYQNYLDGLAQKNPVSSEIFSNKGIDHASILMATLLANTDHSMDMYCQGLRPGILCGEQEGDNTGAEGAYWYEFKKFFQERIQSDDFTNDSIRILIQKKNWIKNAPFRLIREVLANPDLSKKIQVRIISDEARTSIEKALGEDSDVNYNFSIYDGKAFRLEYEPDNYRALGSFNSPSWCSLLLKLFDNAFNTATDIKGEILQ